MMKEFGDVQARLKRFEAWFTENGGILHPAVELGFSDANGVYLRARESIPQETTILSCPHSMTLSALNALDTLPLFPRYRGQDQGDRREDVALREDFLRSAPRAQCIAAVWLCIQAIIGERSWWKPYIDCLPGLPAECQSSMTDGIDNTMGEIATPIWWSEEERQWTAGTSLERGTKDLEAIWQSEWDKWGSKVGDSLRYKRLLIDWSLYKRAMTVLSSRAFSSAQLSSCALPASGEEESQPVLDRFDPDVLLYPLFDFLNHSPKTRNSWHHNSEAFSLICNDEPFPPQEIFNTYGPKNNGQLLLSFGFALPSNPHDAFPLRMSRIDYPVLDGIASNPATVYLDPPPRESKFPPSHDPSNSVFYIRDPSMPGLAELGYAAADSHATFGAFTVALLSRLSLLVASERESQAASKIGTEGSTANAVIAAHSLLSSLLGPRNELAVANILMGRLRYELSRLCTGEPQQSGDLVVPPSKKRKRETSEPGSPARGNLDSNTSGPRRLRRWQNLQTYRTVQKSILVAALPPLRARLASATSSQKPLVMSSPACPDDVRLFTLEQAMALLAQAVVPREPHSEPLIAGFTQLLGEVFPNADPTGIRARDEEEYAWVLLVVFLDVEIPAMDGRDECESVAFNVLAAWIARMRQAYESCSSDAAVAWSQSRRDRNVEGLSQNAMDIVESALDGEEEGGVFEGQWSWERVRFAAAVVREESLVVELGSLERMDRVGEEADRSEMQGIEEEGDPRASIVMVLER